MNTEERKEWLQSRQKGIGSSETPIVLGINKWDDRYSLAMRKLGLIPLDSEPSLPAQRGIALEPLVLDMFQQNTGIQVYKPNVTEVHPDHPFLLRNLDGESLDGETIVEIKCPNLSTFTKCRREGADQNYIAQVQHQLMWPKVKRAFLVIFSAELWTYLDPIEMTPDKELQSLILDEDRKFWNMIQRGEIPAPDESPVIDLPPAGSHEILKINTSEWIAAVRELQEADEILKEAEELKESAKATIKNLMGGFDVAEGGGFRVYNRLTNGRTSVDTKRLKKELPDVYQRFAKQGEPFRTFKSYILKG